MILSEDYLQRLLDAALELVDAPPGCGAVLEGSIAEGFGNDSSDIDFLLIASGDHDFLTMPTVLFIDGRRVEVRMRCVAQIEAQARRARELGRAGPSRDPAGFEDVLNRCQRLSRAVPLRNRPLVESARTAMPAAEIETLVSGWYADRARLYGRYAVALTALGQPRRAAPWIRTALTFGAKSWAAARGETYLGIKWTADQFARAKPAADLLDRFRTLAFPCAEAGVPSGYVRSGLQLLRDLGIGGTEAGPERIFLARRRGVTTWQIGRRVHVVRQRRHVYALGDEAARVWRALVFQVPLSGVLERTRTEPARAGALIADFHRLGLVDLRWRRGGVIAPAPSCVPPPSTDRPIMCTHGLSFPRREEAVRLAPYPAERFAAAGMAQAWANIEVENAREDLAGALKTGQRTVAHSAAHRMLRYACVVGLNALGWYPHPAVEEAPGALMESPDMPRDITTAIEVLERGFTCDRDCVTAGAALQDSLSHLVMRIRQVVDGGLFPSSFESADGWRETLEIGHDWVRLGAYLNSAIPLEEARDVLASAGPRDEMKAGWASGQLVGDGLR